MDQSLVTAKILGAFTGVFMGYMIMAFLFSGLAYVVGRLTGRRWNGWKTGIVVIVLLLLGALGKGNVLELASGLLALLIFIGQARATAAEQAKA